MRLHHSVIPKPDPVRIPTPRTPITAYAYCGDCGADAGTACVDENLRPCSMCPGRVLASTQADRRDAYQRSSAKTATPRVSRAKEPAPDRRARYTATCAHCGVGGLRNQATYCQARECQFVRLRAYRRGRAKPVEPKPCNVCGGPCPPGSSRLKNAVRHWCGDVGCRNVIMAERRRGLKRPCGCCMALVQPPAFYCQQQECQRCRWRDSRRRRDKARMERDRQQTAPTGA